MNKPIIMNCSYLSMI